MATGIEEELELVPKTGFTLDACGQGSNSNFFASFPSEVLSSVTDRVSDKAVEVDGICSHGLPSAGRNGRNGESTVHCRRKGLRIIYSGWW